MVEPYTSSALPPLPPFSLPIRFLLLPSLSSITRSRSQRVPHSEAASLLCPCLAVDLPFRKNVGAEISAQGFKSIEDLTAGAETAAVTVYRILDPEHREPFISLSRIFLACHLTPLEGLLRFDLARPVYDSTLGGIAPYIDLWASLSVARRIAKALNVLDELEGLLEWGSRLAWSLQDRESEGGIGETPGEVEGGGGCLVHNWKVGSRYIKPNEYSTLKMLDTSFDRVILLPEGHQVKTLSAGNVKESFNLETNSSSACGYLSGSFENLWERVVEWTVLEYESWLELKEEYPVPDQGQSPSTNATTTQPEFTNSLTDSHPAGGNKELNILTEENAGQIPDLSLAASYSTFFSLLHLIGGLPLDLTSPSSRQLSSPANVSESEAERTTINSSGVWLSIGGGKLKVNRTMLTRRSYLSPSTRGFDDDSHSLMKNPRLELEYEEQLKKLIGSFVAASLVANHWEQLLSQKVKANAPNEDWHQLKSDQQSAEIQRKAATSSDALVMAFEERIQNLENHSSTLTERWEASHTDPPSHEHRHQMGTLIKRMEELENQFVILNSSRQTLGTEAEKSSEHRTKTKSSFAGEDWLCQIRRFVEFFGWLFLIAILFSFPSWREQSSMKKVDNMRI